MCIRDRFCVGGSETGQILAWRLPDVGTSKPEALPLEIDVKARNARIAAVTAVAFVPAESASATLDAKVLKATYDNTGACLIVPTDDVSLKVFMEHLMKLAVES